MDKAPIERKHEPRQASTLHKVTVTLIALLAVGLSAWAIVSVAADEAVPGRGAHGEHRMGAGGPMQAIARHLDLTEEQQAEVKTIVATTMAEGKALSVQMEGMREQIMVNIRENGYQEDEVRLIAENNMPLLVDMAVLRIRAMAEVYELLTPEQKAEADKFMEQGGPTRWGRHGWKGGRGSS
jgi:Spy/CpxP family protein refolding chaperone